MSYIIGLGLSDLENLAKGAAKQVQDFVQPASKQTGTPASGDPLAAVASNQASIKAKMQGPMVVAAKQLLASAGYQPTSGDVWNQGDEAVVNQYQLDHGIKRTSAFDRDTLASLRAPVVQTLPNTMQTLPYTTQTLPYTTQYDPYAYGPPYDPGMSTGKKVAIGLGALGVVGLGILAITRK